MANPNYATLLAQIAAETDSDARQLLIKQCYVFEEELTEEEQDLFSYMFRNYVEPNPGYESGEYVSYVGVYINDEEEYSGIYP